MYVVGGLLAAADGSTCILAATHDQALLPPRSSTASFSHRKHKVVRREHISRSFNHRNAVSVRLLKAS